VAIVICEDLSSIQYLEVISAPLQPACLLTCVLTSGRRSRSLKPPRQRFRFRFWHQWQQWNSDWSGRKQRDT